MRMAASWSRASQPHRIQGCRRDLLRARGTAPLGSIGHHRRGGRLGMLRVKARAYARPLRGFGLDPSAFPVFVACHHVGGDRRRSAQKSELPHGLTRNAPYKVHPFASNPNHHLVEVPSIAWAWAAPPQLSCDPGPELQNPAPHRLIGNLQAALGEEFLNIAVAQCESEV